MSNKNQFTKSTTPIDDYVCTLPPETQKVAEVELRETESVRRHALQALREWAEKNPRIKSLRLDSNFLLRFLRCRKFSVPMTKEVIERYLVLRHFVHSDMKIFLKLDHLDPMVMELINEGLILVMPKRDHLNRRIILYRAKAYNPSKHYNYNLIRFFGAVFEMLLQDEIVQVHGCVHVVDATGMGLNYITVFTPQEAYKLGRHLEKIVPMRHKRMIGINVHPSFKFVVDFALSQMDDKMKSRVALFKSIDDVDVDRSLLPLEYGGTVPIKDLIEQLKLELAANRQNLLDHDKMDVNIEMYPDPVRNGSVRSLKMTIDEIEADKSHRNTDYGLQGVQGSFRKLEID